MKLIFCLFKYFPYGGLQRDFLRIARTCRDRGHEIHVFTMKWEGEPEPGFTTHFIKPSGWQNHSRSFSFAEKVKQMLAVTPHDLVIGFNKMPHLDIYYGADVCYQSRIRQTRSWLYRLLPRYKTWTTLEGAVFKPGSKTEIILISPLQQQDYMASYHTDAGWFHLLPPGIAKDRIAPVNAAEIREKIRQSFQIPNDHFLLLMVGSGFKTKGLDRAILGMAALPPVLKERCHFFVIGQDRPQSFIKLAEQYKIRDRIHFLGGRSDVAHFLLAGDVLLHPAYHENTGTVLLEAMISGLPVLTVDVCGYAHYVQSADVGMVLPSPFAQTEFNAALQKMLLSEKTNQWRQNGLAFAKEADIYSLPDKAADLIERIGKHRDALFAR